MKTSIDAIREKISTIKSKELFLPERCRSHEDVLFDLINEIEILKCKLDKVHKVLGE